MGLLKFIVWTGCAIGLGIFLGGYRHEGRTPLEHTERLWRQHVTGAPGDSWTDSVRDAWEQARDAVAGEERRAAPRERHSPEDRRALERLISQRGDRDTP